jgi:hypothetical protein
MMARLRDTPLRQTPHTCATTPNTKNRVAMVFQFKASFSVAFNFGPADGGDIPKDIEAKGCRNTITPSPVSQRYSQPQHTSRIQPQTPLKPSRPKLRRFGRFQRTSTPTTVIDPNTETESAKAKDRESLKLLLQATSDVAKSNRADSSNEAMLSGPADYSLVQQVPATPSSTMPGDSFVSEAPLSLPSDSGSNLVSSLQRLRVRGLASYFEQMEKNNALGLSNSSATLIRDGDESDRSDSIVKGKDQIEGVEIDEREVMTLSDVSQG